MSRKGQSRQAGVHQIDEEAFKWTRTAGFPADGELTVLRKAADRIPSQEGSAGNARGRPVREP